MSDFAKPSTSTTHAESDFDIEIVGRRLEPSPSQKWARDLASKLHEHATNQCTNSLERGDLALWLQGQSWITTCANPEMNLCWIYDLGPEFHDNALEQFLEDSASRSKHFEKEAALIKDMALNLMSSFGETTPTESECHLTIRRVRPNHSIEYGILARTPQTEQLATQFIYSSPQAACTQHACEVLYKTFRDGGTRIENGVAGCIEMIPFLKLIKIFTSNRGHDNLVEFMDPESRELRNASEFVLGALMGVFSNETNRYTIPHELLTT